MGASSAGLGASSSEPHARGIGPTTPTHSTRTGPSGATSGSCSKAVHGVAIFVCDFRLVHFWAEITSFGPFFAKFETKTRRPGRSSLFRAARPKLPVRNENARTRHPLPRQPSQGGKPKATAAGFEGSKCKCRTRWEGEPSPRKTGPGGSSALEWVGTLATGREAGGGPLRAERVGIGARLPVRTALAT
jgi:hypothetical protein